MKIQKPKTTLSKIVNLETSDEHLYVNNAICSVSADSPTLIKPVIAEKKEDLSLSNNMIIDDTEHRDVIKRAILHKLDEADKDQNGLIDYKEFAEMMGPPGRS